MRIYVAAKSEEAARARKFMQAIRDVGHYITYDWTTDVLAHAVTPFTKEAQKKCARSDVDAARTADAVIVLYHPGLRGALVEMGVALAKQAPVLVVGCAPDDRCVFFLLAHHVSTEVEAIAFIPHLQSLAIAGSFQ